MIVDVYNRILQNRSIIGPNLTTKRLTPTCDKSIRYLPFLPCKKVPIQKDRSKVDYQDENDNKKCKL